MISNQSPFHLRHKEKKVYKECAGLGCTKNGENLLEILYAKRIARFCNSCTKHLLDSKLAKRPDTGIVERKSISQKGGVIKS